jgi:hypothetical protein
LEVVLGNTVKPVGGIDAERSEVESMPRLATEGLVLKFTSIYLYAICRVRIDRFSMLKAPSLF